MKLILVLPSCPILRLSRTIIRYRIVNNAAVVNAIRTKSVSIGNIMLVVNLLNAGECKSVQQTNQART